MALSTIDRIGLTAMGPQKYKNEQSSVGHFCGKRAMGAKKNGNGPEHFCRSVFFLWPQVYGNEVISAGGHRKNTNLRNCSRLSKHYTKAAFQDEMCPRTTK